MFIRRMCSSAHGHIIQFIIIHYLLIFKAISQTGLNCLQTGTYSICTYIHTHTHTHSLQMCLHTPTDQLWHMQRWHTYLAPCCRKVQIICLHSLTTWLKCWRWECFQTNCRVGYLLRESTLMMCVDKIWNRPNQWVSAIQSGQSMEMAAEVAHIYRLMGVRSCKITT